MGEVTGDFQAALDAFVKQFGFNKGTFVLRRLIKRSTAKVDGKKMREIVIAFSINECAKVCGLSEEQVLKGTSRSHAEARWKAMHLVKFYTNASYAELGKLFGITGRAVMYAVTKCREMLEVPKFERQFNERYLAAEKSLIAYITKIKKDG